MHYNRILEGLNDYCKLKNYSGYDPYDFLNSEVPNIIKNNDYFSLLLTQLFKFSPINFRKLFRTKVSRGPKELSLFLISYINMYRLTRDEEIRDECDKLFRLILKSRLNKKCFWGSAYDFYVGGALSKAEDPASVSSAYVGVALVQYYQITKNPLAKKLIQGLADYFLTKMFVQNHSSYFLYSSTKLDMVINLNALVLMFFSLSSQVIEIPISTKKKLDRVFDQIINLQKKEGYWLYCDNNSVPSFQIDYHQGFIVESIFEYTKNFNIENAKYKDVVFRGADYYMGKQFLSTGQSKYGPNKLWPSDIHNQAQGIITFSKLGAIDKRYAIFSKIILEWTLNNMLSDKSFFYYQKWPLFTNKISYMRWSQAWSSLSLSTYLLNSSNSGKNGKN